MSAGLFFQEETDPDGIKELIDAGIKIFATDGGSDGGAATADIGRRYTRRTMPF